MDWRAAIDAYCERTGPEFWSEPINAASNLAFILAAILPYAAMRRRGVNDPLLSLLCGIAFCIGIGSFLFHTYAERWSVLADVIPILIFIVVFLYAAMLRLFGLRGIGAIIATVVAFGLSLFARSAGLSVTGGSLNGSEGYFPALALLGGSALMLRLSGRAASRPVAVATVIFAISLTARTADAGLCPYLPFGTHFLWHLFNGAMIAVLLFTVLQHGRQRA